jgi:site-specific DNA-cytosine methylase
VTGAEILAAVGRERGDVDVLEGSPPCASFSTAGKRSAGWGSVKPYSDTSQRVDDLFFEYARLVDEIRPRAFVAENVSGLVKGVAKGYFLEILRALRAPGYVVAARLLDAQWLGVPQARQRIIFVGVRADLVERYGVGPAFPTPLRYRYSIRDALPGLAAVDERTGPGFARTTSELDAPINAILVSDPAQTRYEIVEAVSTSDGRRLARSAVSDGPVTRPGAYDVGADARGLAEGRARRRRRRERRRVARRLRDRRRLGPPEARRDVRAVPEPVAAERGGAVADGDGDRRRRRRRCSRRRRRRDAPDGAAEVHDRGAPSDLRVPGRLRPDRDVRAAVGAARARRPAADDASRRGYAPRRDPPEAPR